MDPLVVVALLAASLLHASWHALVKSSTDRLTALAGMNLVSGLAAFAVLPFVPVPPVGVLLIISGSVLMHGVYKVGLAWLYVRVDFGQAYPLARGLTPIMSTMIGFATIGELPKPAALIGISLISLGLVALLFERTGRHITLSAFVAAILTGLMVAAYSVIDACGVRLNGDWLGFTAWLIACDSIVFMSYVLCRQGPRTVLGAWRTGRLRVLISGTLGLISFSAFIWALGRAQVGAVSALRETSVLFAALIGGVALRESSSWVRYVAAVLVMAGIMTMAGLR
jgi:drug/metabolite transporter (DMT)-like permease